MPALISTLELVEILSCLYRCVCWCVCARLNNVPSVMGPSEVSAALDLLPAIEGLTQIKELG